MPDMLKNELQMALGELKVHAETITVRECPKCRARWPGDWEYCQNCAVWLPGNERRGQITTIVPRAGLIGTAPHLVPGGTVLAAEVRCDSDCPRPWQLDRARKLLKDLIIIIRRHGGTASPIAGRGVVGHWEDPRGVEQAARALCSVASATAPIDRPEGPVRMPGESVNLGVGVVTVEGPPVASQDRAFRLAALAHPDRLFFCREAYERIVERFDFRGLQPVAPKSESSGAVYELVGPKPQRSGTHHVGPETVPLLGRFELAEAIEQCRQKAARGETVVVHLVGPPGHGKSKLIREWIGECDRLARLQGWTRLSCNGVPYGDYSLRSWRSLTAPLVSEEDLNMGGEIPGVRAIAERIGSLNQPAILIVDDLHWIDLGSRDLIMQLISQLRAALAIFAYRPSFVSGASWDSPTLHRCFQIAPLGREMITLVDMLSEESGVKLSLAARREIVAKSHGSPLYATEAVAYLARAGPDRAQSLPESLIELLILRIRWTAEELLPELDRRARFFSSPARSLPLYGTPKELVHDMEGLEEQLSAWLDRFDVVEEEHTEKVVPFLDGLRRIDSQLAILGILMGWQRPHRNRLAQALTRVESCVGSSRIGV